MLFILLFITLLYVALIGSFIYGFDKVDDFELSDVVPEQNFSVVIPFRNEARNLPDLLNSVAELNYPKSKFEIIFVNDDSEDNSEDIVVGFFKKNNLKDTCDFTIIKNIRTSTSPKKDAITLAIAQAKYDWIVTTDADCSLPKFWLDAFDGFVQRHSPNCIAAPVCYDDFGSFSNRFQALDILSLQGATIGGFGIKKPFMCNGANFGYKKSMFETVNGFEGNYHISSGDDLFLLEKILKQNASKVGYLKSAKAVVTTKPQSNFKSLVSQRVRWAAKTNNYNNGFGKVTALIVFAMNGCLVCLPLLCLARIVSIKTFAYLFLIKLAIDFLLLFKTARFLEQESVLTSYLFSSLLYPFFSVYIAFISIFTGYKWKGRQYKK